MCGINSKLLVTIFDLIPKTCQLFSLFKKCLVFGTLLETSGVGLLKQFYLFLQCSITKGTKNTFLDVKAP